MIKFQKVNKQEGDLHDTFATYHYDLEKDQETTNFA